MKTLRIEIRLSEVEYKELVQDGLCDSLAGRDWTDPATYRWELGDE